MNTRQQDAPMTDDGEAEVARELARVEGELSRVNSEISDLENAIEKTAAKRDKAKERVIADRRSWRLELVTFLLGCALGAGLGSYTYFGPGGGPRLEQRLGPGYPQPPEHGPAGFPLVPPR